MLNYLYVAIGSAVGGILRFAVGGWVQGRLADVIPHAGTRAFPIGTLVVNVSGSLLIGMLLVLAGKGGPAANTIQFLLIVGLCGGFTTFSTFSADTISLLQNDGAALAAVNIVASLLLTFLATYTGIVVTRALLGPAT